MNCEQCVNQQCENNNFRTVEQIWKDGDLPLITSIFLNVTQKCNLKCKYCFIDQYAKEMSYDTAKRAVDFIIENSKIQGDIPSINFFGGEPMLKWDEIIVPLTKYIRKQCNNNFQLSMTTNGTLLNEERLQFIKDNNIGIMISIDGDKPTQDLNRPLHNGKSSFDLIINNIPKALKLNPNMTFRMTLDHDNCKQLLHNCKFAIEKGYNNIFFIVNVFTKWTNQEVNDLVIAINEVANWYIELIREGRDISISQFDYAFGNIKKINRFNETASFRNATDAPAYGRCGLGSNRFASIGPDGEIYSCQEMVGNRENGDKFIIGNLFTEIYNDKRWEIINSFDVKKVRCSDSKRCKTCRLHNICDGYCSINNYFSCGDLTIVPEILCKFYNICLDTSINIMNTLAGESNELFKTQFNRR